MQTDPPGVDPPPARPARWRPPATTIELVVTALFALGLAWPFLRPGRAIIPFDGAAYSGPNLRFTVDEWSAGRLPLWNDLIFGGVAHLGNPQTGALYPLKLLVAGLPTARAMNVLVAGHIVGFVLGLLWVARRLGLRPPAGFVVAAAAGASGAALVKSTQFEQYLVLAWAPFVLVATHAVLTSTRPWRAVPVAGATMAMTFLAGHPQITYLLACLAAAWALGVAWSARRWRRLTHLAAAGTLAAAISALQLLAAIHATRDSAVGAYRTLAAIDERWVVAPSRLAQVLFGTVLERDPAEFAGGFELPAFVGAVAAVLAVAGVVAGWRDRDRRPLTIALALGGAGALVAALGPATIAFRAAYRLVPGFALARVPARWMDVVVIVAAVFAGIAVDALVARRIGRAELVAVGATTIVVLAGVLTGRLDSGGAGTVTAWIVAGALASGALAIGTVRRAGRLPARAAIVLAVLVAVELGIGWARGGALRPAYDVNLDRAGDPATVGLADAGGLTVAFTDEGSGDPYQTVAGLRPNANVFRRIRSLDGYDGGVQVTTRWLDLVLRFHDGPDFTLPLRNQLDLPLDPGAMARLDVRYVVLQADRDATTHVAGWEGPIAGDARLTVWENPAWRSEATLWFATELVPDDAAAARLLRGAAGQRATTALVEPGGPLIACDTGCTPQPVALTRVDPRHLRVELDAPHRAVVAVGAQYDSGWAATVDGVAVPSFPVDGFFLGAAVPAGTHTVELHYSPGWVSLGTGVSAAGIIATIGLLAGEAGYHRRRGRRHAAHHR